MWGKHYRVLCLWGGLLASFAVRAQTTFSQEPSCATRSPDLKNVRKSAVEKFRIHLNAYDRVPVRLHIQESEGEAVLDASSARHVFEKALETFDFLPKPFEVESVESSTSWNARVSREMITDADAIRVLTHLNRSRPREIHVIFAKDQPGQTCGLTLLPPDLAQGIVISTSQRCDMVRSLIHELGHFFLLKHTHEGYGTLHQEGSSRDPENCEFKGDGFCSTPPDPLLGPRNVDAQCRYVGPEAYAPDTRNHMSYTRDGCADHFNDDQKAAMNEAFALFVGLPDEAKREPASLKITDIFPNPASPDEPVTIRYETRGVLRERVWIYDAMGRLVWQQLNTSVSDSFEREGSRKGEVVWQPSKRLASGTYVVVVSEANGRKAARKQFILNAW